MVPGVGRAQIDEALTIQPIEVCDPSGACATADFPTIQAVLNAVWRKQALLQCC
jgi:hypothetical protein